MARLGPTCPSGMVTAGQEVLPGLDIIPCGCLRTSIPVTGEETTEVALLSLSEL